MFLIESVIAYVNCSKPSINYFSLILIHVTFIESISDTIPAFWWIVFLSSQPKWWTGLEILTYKLRKLNCIHKVYTNKQVECNKYWAKKLIQVLESWHGLHTLGIQSDIQKNELRYDPYTAVYTWAMYRIWKAKVGPKPNTIVAGPTRVQIQFLLLPLTYLIVIIYLLFIVITNLYLIG